MRVSFGLFTALAVLIAVCLPVGCVVSQASEDDGGIDASDTDVDTDADNDSDSDSDSDTDGDTDGDTDVDGGGDADTDSDSDVDAGEVGYGDSCTAATAATDCGGGTAAKCFENAASAVWPGGYCTRNCGDAINGGGCGTTARCIGLNNIGFNGKCVRKCTSDADCRADEGYACLTFDDSGISPGISSPTAKFCLPTAKLGAPCTQSTVDADCGGVVGMSTCITSTYFGAKLVKFPGGYCSKACYDGTGGTGCGEGGTCVGLISLPTYGACYEKCGGAGDCRTADDYACQTFVEAGIASGTTAPAGVDHCLPGGDADTDADTDSDTDADTDSDTDGDTDVDAGFDAGFDAGDAG
jgi:hypothetical protein